MPRGGVGHLSLFLFPLYTFVCLPASGCGAIPLTWPAGGLCVSWRGYRVKPWIPAFAGMHAPGAPSDQGTTRGIRRHADAGIRRHADEGHSQAC